MDDEDMVLWRYKDDKFKHAFNAKSMWLFIQGDTVRVDWHKGVWFPYSSPRYAFWFG